MEDLRFISWHLMRFADHKSINAFTYLYNMKVMSIVKVYQPLLRDIKLEYESLVNHVISAQKYSEKMEDEIKTASSYPTTIENHERYRNELREK